MTEMILEILLKHQYRAYQTFQRQNLEGSILLFCLCLMVEEIRLDWIKGSWMNYKGAKINLKSPLPVKKKKKKNKQREEEYDIIEFRFVSKLVIFFFNEHIIVLFLYRYLKVLKEPINFLINEIWSTSAKLITLHLMKAF